MRPMPQRDKGFYAFFSEHTDDGSIVSNRLIAEFPLLGLHARPFNGKPMRIYAERCHEPHVFRKTAILIRRRSRNIIFFLERTWVALKNIIRPFLRFCAFDFAL